MLEIEASLPSVQATGTASVHERVETEAQGEGETSVTSRLLESRRHIEETRERIEAVMKDRQEERSDRLREAKERQSDAIEELRQPDESD
jgi:hypothetical protein